MEIIRLFVPEIGTKITLAEDWSFSLYCERRNEALLDATNHRTLSNNINCGYYSFYNLKDKEKEFIKEMGWHLEPSVCARYDDCYNIVTLPMGTILTVDRIYVRKGSSDFSSISFNVDKKSIEKNFSDFATRVAGSKGRCRFWAKLKDCNKIHF